MNGDAFADSSVERAANGGDWPPAHIAHYNYDDQQQQQQQQAQQNHHHHALVDMNLDEDPMLGDVRSAEEQSLLSGDIEPAEQYKAKHRQSVANAHAYGNASPFNHRRDRGNNAPKQQQHASILMQQASGMKAAFRDKLSSQTRHQMDKYEAPSFESNLGLTAWCIAFFYWIPIRYMAFVGCLALFILPFLDVRFQRGITFVEWLLYWYIQLFSIVGIFVESPTWILTRRVQLTIYKWCRVLRRTWGRALFYISVSLLTFAELENGTMMTLSMFAGVYMAGLALIMLMFSALAAKQYRLLYWYMASGGNINGKDLKLVGDEYGDRNANVQQIEYDKLVSRVASYFDELDHDRDGKIGAGEVHSFAEQALKRSLSNAERYTIQTFLDNSCNGYISKQDWIKQFCDYGKVKFL
mmetsp:Transcript_10792/g.16238  ORF Transcript_10792/g.16238 Transcript_10792/m.16238 type:complete len:411 (+) Transcript_10792:87-1319(+)